MPLRHWNVNFGTAIASDADTSRMHGVWIAADQRVPISQFFTLVHLHVGAARRQPVDLFCGDRTRRQTIRNMGKAISILLALTGAGVQQSAGYVGVVNFASILIFEFVQTATATPITQRLPFSVVQFVQGFVFPETFCVTHALASW